MQCLRGIFLRKLCGNLLLSTALCAIVVNETSHKDNTQDVEPGVE